jgi:hypothetical protein
VLLSHLASIRQLVNRSSSLQSWSGRFTQSGVWLGKLETPEIMIPLLVERIIFRAARYKYDTPTGLKHDTLRGWLNMLPAFANL